MDTDKVRRLLTKLRAEKQPDPSLVTELAEVTETLLTAHEQMTVALHRGCESGVHLDPSPLTHSKTKPLPDRTLEQRASDSHRLR